MEIEIDDSGTAAAGAKQFFETQTFRAPEEISGSSTAANERFGIAHGPFFSFAICCRSQSGANW